MSLRKVVRVMEAQSTTDGAGVRLRRSIGSRELDHLDPFLLFDEFKAEDSAEYVGGFPDHPHRGFETVTYMLAGVMEHRDHRGNTGRITAGSVQWMTAGRGIIHSEMPKQHEGLLWGFQLWINLPAKDKMCEPRYQDIPGERIPEVMAAGDARVRVVAGEFMGQSGPVAGIATHPLYLDVSLPAGSRFRHEVPSAHNAFCYVVDGKGRLGDPEEGEALSSGRLAVLGEGDEVAVRSEDGVRFLLLAARPLGEPVARLGPFVMNTREQVMQALQDFQEGHLLD
jgi:redox-sensitive bicupin YhaK (pirin superfamily)